MNTRCRSLLFGLGAMVCFLFSQNVWAVDQYPTYPVVKLPSGSEAAASVKRGEYLVKMGDCIACHTTYYGGKPFAGGFAIPTPFGTIYTPNITSDKKFGIGAWTNAQFVTAMREGISPTGKYYYPAFPYLYFNTLTTRDLVDIKSYLDATPPVAQANRDNSMMFPFNWRFLQLGWRMMFFNFQKTGPVTPDSKQSAEWNRGKYLVDGLGHCGMCHTPSHYMVMKSWSLAAPIQKYYLTGQLVQGYFAPDITSNLMKNTPLTDLQNVFYKNQMIGGGTVQGPMYEANRDSLSYLSPADSAAIWTYLKTVHSETPPKPSTAAGSGPGADIYNAHCTGCHETGAGGAPKVGDNTAWAPIIKQNIETTYKNALNGIGGMPAKGTCSSCTDEQIKQAVTYMINSSKPGAAGSSQGIYTLNPTSPQAAPLTLADGQQVYNKYCAACHNPSMTYPGAPHIGDQVAWAPVIDKGMSILILNTINGVNNMPARGSCRECNDAQLIAAVKYMVHQSKTGGNYSLW